MKKEFQVTGMHCASCAIDIKETLEDLNGVRAATVDYESGAASVEYDNDKLSQSEIIETISELGYQAHEQATQNLDEQSHANA